MNFKNYILLISFLSILIFSCQNQSKDEVVTKEDKIIINENIKKNRWIPNDGVYKFNSLEADILAKKIYTFFDKYDINSSKEEKQKIENWLNKKVFSNTKENYDLLEWYIDDDDLCQNVNLISKNFLKNSIDTVYSRVCNSVLQEGVSLKSEWVLEIEDRYIMWLSFCPNIKQELGIAYERQIIKLEEDIEDFSTITTKYESDITIYIHIELYDKNKEINDSIITDKGIVFTRLYDDYQSILEKSKKSVK